MFQVLASQSRYELQQQTLLNPNGLEINTSNRFGDVDASGNISSIKSVSHPNFGENVQQGTLSGQPNLIVDEFGVGKNAILFNGSTDRLLIANPSFAPDWDEEFWIAGEFKTNGSSLLTPWSIAQGSINLFGIRSVFSGTNQFVLALRAENLFQKIIRTTSTFTDNLIHSYIFYWAGTDNVNDAKMFIDGIEETTINTDQGTFVGQSLYPLAVNINLFYGCRQDSNAYYNRYHGKLIMGYGYPNVSVITNSLNSI